MKFNILSEVIYLDEHGNKIYTYIEELNQDDQTYIINHNKLMVTEEQLTENPLSDFSNPPKDVKESMANYAIDFNIAMIISKLCTDIEDKEIAIERLGTDIVITYSPTNTVQLDHKAQIKANLLKLIESYRFNFLRKMNIQTNLFLVYPYTNRELLKTISI